jgi:hypothetical protein
MAAAYRMPRNAIKRKEPVKQAQKNTEIQAGAGTGMDNETILGKMESFLLELGKLRL